MVLRRRGRDAHSRRAGDDADSAVAQGELSERLVRYVKDRPGHDRRYAIDCAKIQRELGWAPRESFATGLAKTVDWYLAHREWAADITAEKYARERLGVA